MCKIKHVWSNIKSCENVYIVERDKIDFSLL